MIYSRDTPFWLGTLDILVFVLGQHSCECSTHRKALYTIITIIIFMVITILKRTAYMYWNSISAILKGVIIMPVLFIQEQCIYYISTVLRIAISV